jgi:hypothetical protein
MELQVKGDLSGRIRIAWGAEHERSWKLANKVWPQDDECTKRTPRGIPVVVLERIRRASGYPS